MPAVYMPAAAEGFELCHPRHSEDFETLNATLDGTPRSTSWRSPPMRLVREDERKPLREADCPWLGSHALVFRRDASVRVAEHLQRHGEFLPLDCADADLVLYNVTRVVDAMDEAASQVVRFANGRIMRVLRYAFTPHIVSTVDVFKIPNFRVSPIYVREGIVQAFKNAGIRGLDFKRVWSP